jgi:hypothetical protein
VDEMNNKRLRYSLEKVISAALMHTCEDMHHKKAHQHDQDEMCPVEYELNQHIHALQEYFKSQGV